MAERQDSHPEAEKKSSGGQALVQIGHYVLGETLGIGTFGKVKGKTKYDGFNGWTAWNWSLRIDFLFKVIQTVDWTIFFHIKNWQTPVKLVVQN